MRDTMQGHSDERGRGLMRWRGRIAWWVSVACLLLGMASPPAAFGDEIAIAAASDLSFAFKELTVAFEKAQGIRVRLSLGSSGNFFSQIQQGAPFDLYFSADVRYPQKLIEAGQAAADSLYRYAVGRIVVWVPNASALAVDRLGLDVLLDRSVKKIAIANPKHAPYGRAAVAALEQAKLYERVKDKLVFGENVSQAAQFVESGAAEAGVIALSLALAPPMHAAGTYWLVPDSAHLPLEQGAVIVSAARNREGAQAFLRFLKTEEATRVMARYGFLVPE